MNIKKNRIDVVKHKKKGGFVLPFFYFCIEYPNSTLNIESKLKYEI